MANYDYNKYYKILQQCSIVATNVVSVLRELLSIKNYCLCPSYGEKLLINAKTDLETIKIKFDEITLYEFCNDYPHPYFDVLDACRLRTDISIANIALLLELFPCCDPTRVCEFVSICSKLYSDALIIKSDCYFLIRYAQIEGGL